MMKRRKVPTQKTLTTPQNEVNCKCFLECDLFIILGCHMILKGKDRKPLAKWQVQALVSVSRSSEWEVKCKF